MLVRVFATVHRNAVISLETNTTNTKSIFPFVIVEVKHKSVDDAEKRHCYCQAANAASSALATLCSLNQHNPRARYWQAGQHKILPIVSFTFIGYNVKVWLVYVSYYKCFEDKEHSHKYVSRLKALEASERNTD